MSENNVRMATSARPTRAARWLAATLVAALVAGAAASAATGNTFRFEGRGYGHGVGMSQFGARGAALAGLDAKRILAHYYRHTSLSKVPQTSLRVRIAESRARVTLGGEVAVRAIATGESAQTTLSRNASFRAVVRNGVVEIVGHTGRVRLRASRTALLWPARPRGMLTMNGRRFRGALQIVPVGQRRFDVVNVVNLEHYLAGVLPREVPADWGDDTPAALEAQAIAARSYALASRQPGSHFDLHADVRSQVYGGADGEDPRTTAAVRATRGAVVTHGGKVITAFFFSTSGGRTENVENVFGGDPQPYLVSVRDPYDRTSPYHRRWPDPPTVSGARLGALLGLGSPVRSFRVAQRGASPRVISAQVQTADGQVHTVSGATVRRALKLRDTWFRVVRTAMPPAGG